MNDDNARRQRQQREQDQLVDTCLAEIEDDFSWIVERTHRDSPSYTLTFPDLTAEEVLELVKFRDSRIVRK